MSLAYTERRALADLSWVTTSLVQDAWRTLLDHLQRGASGTDRFARFCRAALPVGERWGHDRRSVWIDNEAMWLLDLDSRMRLGLNLTLIRPFWLMRTPGDTLLSGEESRAAFFASVMGLIIHDLTHVLVWIAHERQPGFSTICLSEELNCTLWAGTAVHVMATGQTENLDDPAGFDLLLEALRPVVFATHVQEYLKNRGQMLERGPALGHKLESSRAARALMKDASELVPEHPAAERAYQRFTQWTESRGDPLDWRSLSWPGAGDEPLVSYKPRARTSSRRVRRSARSS